MQYNVIHEWQSKFDWYSFWGQIQRKLQLRIEEQGKHLQMLFDQQQKASKDHSKPQNLEKVPEDDPPFNFEGIEFSTSENSGNSHFT